MKLGWLVALVLSACATTPPTPQEACEESERDELDPAIRGNSYDAGAGQIGVFQLADGVVLRIRWRLNGATNASIAAGTPITVFLEDRTQIIAEVARDAAPFSEVHAQNSWMRFGPYGTSSTITTSWVTDIYLDADSLAVLARTLLTAARVQLGGHVETLRPSSSAQRGVRTLALCFASRS